MEGQEKHDPVNRKLLERKYDEMAALRQELADAMGKEDLNNQGTPLAPADMERLAKQPVVPWRTRHTTTTAQFDMMRFMEMQTDCTITVTFKDEATLVKKVHRLQLIRASPVFEAMLTGDMLEAKTGEIRITDIPPMIVEKMLNFIYCDEVNLTLFEEACMLAFVADKYQMKALLDISVSLITKLFTNPNVWTALKLANLLRLQNLKDSCIEVLQEETIDCIGTEKFLETTEENVCILLDQDVLHVESEIYLVEATINWARREAQRRGLIGDDAGVRTVIEPNILRLLRLATIPPRQFQTGPGLCDWLTQSEKEQIMEFQEFKNAKLLPEHLSSCRQPRIRPYVFFAFENQITQCCKRNALTTEHNLEIKTPMLNCPTCLLMRFFQRALPLQFDRRTICAHSNIIFRVTAECRLMGFECPTRILNDPDPTLLISPKLRPVYRETMSIIFFDKGPSLTLKTLQEFKLIFQMAYKEFTEYDSTLVVTFPRPVNLSVNNWYALFIIFYSNGELFPMEYPYCTRPTKVTSKTEGLKFMLHTGHIDNHYKSENDGMLKSFLYVA